MAARSLMLIEDVEIEIAQLEKAVENLKIECSGLKEANLKLDEGTEEVVKAGVEIFRNQFDFTSDYENIQSFFVNFGSRQVLSKLKELHPTIDISSIEEDYPAPEDAEDVVDQPYHDMRDSYKLE
ncbi:Uncharacterized protein Fot_02564 [Forsythia ovata]|uniref:Uncharacterized protein n=1 Tax=Forsythia ovata TaxID=205694 RepID=A0ABD1XB87_9LAMI